MFKFRRDHKKNQSSFTEISDLILKMDEQQLVQLHNIVAERLNLIQKARNISVMAAFNLGDTVYFERHGETISGTIQRLNQKTVSLETKTGQKWNVSPGFLRKYIDVKGQYDHE